VLNRRENSRSELTKFFADTNRAAKVHRLQPINDDQKQLFDQGYANSLIRKAQSDSRLAEKPPTSEEIAALHELFKLKNHSGMLLSANRQNSSSNYSRTLLLLSQVIQGNWIDLRSTRYESTFLMHPEYKNLVLNSATNCFL
jgi:hypothetical protein